MKTNAEISPESFLSKVPGIGPTLAARIHRELGVDSLEELEIAAHDGKKWLPIMEVEKDGWSLTALFSNTARAHDLGTTRDWVVIDDEREGNGEDQCTVITAGSGPLEGRRIVVGREQECLEYDR